MDIKRNRSQPDQHDPHPDPQPNQPERKHKSPEEWQSLVLERIEEAIERGDFDNLPGAGKPLRLHDNPNEPADMRMANRLLKNNNLAPAWILDRRALLIEMEKLRMEIGLMWDDVQREYSEEQNEARRAGIARAWAGVVADWDERVRDLNSRILDLNITLPIWRMELIRFNLDREFQRLGARRRLDP